MTFVPITALIEDVIGKDHLARAISLYLEYKPPIEELRCFLNSKYLGLMGHKLYVSQEQISVGRRPVTGLRLCLEGSKQNRLSIHLQHLASLPKILLPHWDTHVAIGAPKWRGPEEQDSRWFVPVKWKKFSHVSTGVTC
ncbi:cinnamoyl-Coa reductase [Ancistrocladus abbreviatus]